jgi:putative Mn2+ efflux pump MntP
MVRISCFHIPGATVYSAHMVALLVVAVALGLDNFAASVAIGIGGVDRRTRLRVAGIFGLFETAMPAIGLLIGHGLAGELGPAARWTGAATLAAAGVYQFRRDDTTRGWHGWRLLASGAALSLDNLAVGFALGAVRVPVAVAVTVFGVATVVMSMIGLEVGARVGTAAGDRGEILAGIVLICVGIAMAAALLRRERRQVAVLV